METFVIIFIIILAIIVAISLYVSIRHSNALLEEGAIIKREGEFYKQRHVFVTKIETIEQIGNALDKTVLQEKKISYEPNYESGKIVFHNQAAGGTFGASMISLGFLEENRLYGYEFQIRAWKELNGSTMTGADINGSNILLTAIERAVFSLDKDAKVERTNATFKSKTSFL